MCRHCPSDVGTELRAAASAPRVDFGDLGEVRKLLPQGCDLSDAEVAEIRDLALRTADAIYSRWVRSAGRLGNPSHNMGEGQPPSPP